MRWLLLWWRACVAVDGGAAAVAAVVGACFAEVSAGEWHAAAEVAWIAHGRQLTAAGGLRRAARAEACHRADATTYLARDHDLTRTALQTATAAVRHCAAAIGCASTRRAALVLVTGLAIPAPAAIERATALIAATTAAPVELTTTLRSAASAFIVFAPLALAACPTFQAPVAPI